MRRDPHGIASGRRTVHPFPSWGATFGQFFAGWHPSGVGTTAPAAPGARDLRDRRHGAPRSDGPHPEGVGVRVHPARGLGCGPPAAAFRVGAGCAGRRHGVPRHGASLRRARDSAAGARWCSTRGCPGSSHALSEATRASAPSAPAPEQPPTRGRLVVRARTRWSARCSASECWRRCSSPSCPRRRSWSSSPRSAWCSLRCVFGDGGRPAGRSASLRVRPRVAGLICLPWLDRRPLGRDRARSPCSGRRSLRRARPRGARCSASGSDPIGDSPLAWGFAVAGVVPLVLARGERFRLAARFWVIAVVAWVVAWVIGRGWTGQLAIDTLGPARARLRSRSPRRSGSESRRSNRTSGGPSSAGDSWRRSSRWEPSCSEPFRPSCPRCPGRFDLPVNDFSQSVTWMPARAPERRVPSALARGPSGAQPGRVERRWRARLCHLRERRARRRDGCGTGPPQAPRPGSPPRSSLARADRTDRLGRMLAPAGVRYVVLLTSLAPEIGGRAEPRGAAGPRRRGTRTLPAARLGAGGVGHRHHRLRQCGLDPPARRDDLPAALRRRFAAAPRSSPRGRSCRARRPPARISGPPRGRHRPRRGRPSGSLRARDPIRHGQAGPWLGWASSYRVTRQGTATLSFDGGAVTPLADLLAVATWLAALAALLLRSRAGRPSEGPSAGFRRRRRSTPAKPTETEEEDDLGLPLEEVAP